MDKITVLFLSASPSIASITGGYAQSTPTEFIIKFDKMNNLAIKKQYLKMFLYLIFFIKKDVYKE